jgi:hypothetical protein
MSPDISPVPICDLEQVDLTGVRLAIPEGADAALITAAAYGRGGVLEGVWLPTLLDLTDGDVAVALSHCHEHHLPARGLHADVWLCHDGHLLPGGSWCHLGQDWAEAVRNTINTLMNLHGAVEQSLLPCAVRLDPDTRVPDPTPV